MTKRIRTTKTRKRRTAKTRNKTMKRGGMFNAFKSKVSGFFQSSPIMYANNDFVKQLRPLLKPTNKTDAEVKATAIKKLMQDNQDQINNVIWTTIVGSKYTIYESNNRAQGGSPMLLLQILINVPEFKRDRSIYHVFLDNGGDIDKKTNPNGLSLSQQIDFNPVDERRKKKSNKSKKNKSTALHSPKKRSSSKEEMQVIEEGVDDEGPIESVVGEPEKVQVEEDIVKSDLGLSDIRLEMPRAPTAVSKKQKPTLDFTLVPSYDATNAFWEPLFPGTELDVLKSKFDALVQGDVELKHNELCRLCEMVQTIIPSFSVRSKLQREKKDENDIKEKTVFDQPDDLRNMNIILCSTVLLLGFVAKKLEKQDYTFMFKGGKSVQLAFAYVKNDKEYKSEDIDILIIPNKSSVEYNSDKAKALAFNISYLIRWVLNATYEKNLDSQIMETNPMVVKLAYQAFLRDGKPFGNKTALVDIDFSDIPEVNRPFYRNKTKMFYGAAKPIRMVDDDVFSDDGKPYFGEDMLFYFQSMEQQIHEKLYYYLLYTKYKKQLQERNPILEEEYKTLTVSTCNYFLAKFKRSLLALLRGYGKNYSNLFSEFAEDDRVSEVLDKVRAELTKEIES